MKDKFPRDIRLEESWFEFHYDKYSEAKSNYLRELRELDDISYKADEMVIVKTFVADYNYQDDPEYLLDFYKEITDYIKGDDSLAWDDYSTGKDYVDANDDPYDDYEHETLRITVYARLKERTDVSVTKIYQDQVEVVQHFYRELLRNKKYCDDVLKKGKPKEE